MSAESANKPINNKQGITQGTNRKLCKGVMDCNGWLKGGYYLPIKTYWEKVSSGGTFNKSYRF